MSIYRFFVFFIFFIFYFNFSYAAVLDEIKERGYLICGVSEPRIGFANIDDESNWIGFDVDLCRAVATAIFGDPLKVEFIATTSRSRFPMLAGGELDLLSRITTWTFSRDVNLSFEFTGINFFDGQGFMVNSSLGIDSAFQLDGSTICTIEGSVSDFNVNNFFKKNNMNYKILPVEYNDEALENFLVERCDVYTDYVTELAYLRTTLQNPSNYNILPEIISKEPLSMVIRHGDDQWRDVVTWSFNVLILAEELEINSQNIDQYENTENDEILRILGLVGSYGDMIELDEKWAYNIIKLVGNYKEIFERNLGKNTILNLNRGLNKLYSEGGLLYSPPFR